MTFLRESVTFWYFIGLIGGLSFYLRFAVDIRKSAEVRLSIGCGVTLQPIDIGKDVYVYR